MARDDWRIRIEVAGEDRAGGFLEQLRSGLGDEAQELARELERRRLVVSRDGNEIFVYAGSRDEAERARAIVESELRAQEIEATVGPVEWWIPAEERWSAEPPGETWEEEELEHGHAPWEVRVECRSHAEARELADRLAREGYGVVRRWRYVIAGTDSREEAEALAARLHGEVEPGGEVVWESAPGNPFAVFGGLGGSGTPV
jgi:hypothetical protein